MGNEVKESLYNLNAELLQIFESISQNDGEITESEEEKIEKLQVLLRDKVDACFGFHSYLIDQEENIKKRIDELKTLKDSVEKKHNNFLKNIETCLKMSDKKEFKGNLCIIKEKKKSKVVKILDEDKIPFEFLKTIPAKTEVSKSLIAKALKNGEAVDGAELVDSDKPSLILKMGV